MNIKEIYSLAKSHKYSEFENALAEKFFNRPPTENTTHLTDSLRLTSPPDSVVEAKEFLKNRFPNVKKYQWGLDTELTMYEVEHILKDYAQYFPKVSAIPSEEIARYVISQWATEQEKKEPDHNKMLESWLKTDFSKWLLSKIESKPKEGEVETMRELAKSKPSDKWVSTEEGWISSDNPPKEDGYVLGRNKGYLPIVLMYSEGKFGTHNETIKVNQWMPLPE